MKKFNDSFVMLLIMGVLTLFLFVTVSFFLTNQGRVTIELIESHKNKWLQREPQDYTYIIVEGCMSVNETQVFVINGKETIESNDGTSSRNIASLFEDLDKVVGKVNKLEVEFDASYNYPKSYSVDYDKDVIDDECFSSVTDFKVIN